MTAATPRTLAWINYGYLLLMMLVIAAILTAAMAMQYIWGELPCPLCLLQRAWRALFEHLLFRFGRATRFGFRLGDFGAAFAGRRIEVDRVADAERDDLYRASAVCGWRIGHDRRRFPGRLSAIHEVERERRARKRRLDVGQEILPEPRDVGCVRHRPLPHYC